MPRDVAEGGSRLDRPMNQGRSCAQGQLRGTEGRRGISVSRDEVRRHQLLGLVVRHEGDVFVDPALDLSRHGFSVGIENTAAARSLRSFFRCHGKSFRHGSRARPSRRAKRRGLLRNVAVALGNWGAPEAVPALAVALNDEEALVRGHAAWALGRIGTEAARQALRGREEAEEDAWVREEIAAALDVES
jgi:HEAT repeats